jgi:hypothetical protein
MHTPATKSVPFASDEEQFGRDFECPPSAYGPTPFYWWAGQPLDRERISAQLDQLSAQGVRQTVISYPHNPDGSTDVGDPPLFSGAWWELFRWFLDQSERRNMTVGFQDYTLIEPILTAIGNATKDMQGGQLGSVSQLASYPEQVGLRAEPGTLTIGAWAYAVTAHGADGATSIDLSGHLAGLALAWMPPPGRWLVVLVFARLSKFDPLHPESGALVIDRFYSTFERECPDQIGRTLTLFFQDELDFGGRMPFWSNRLAEAFIASKGYDIVPLLPALWHDIGPATVKIRLDYADSVTQRMEECYFKPIFHWHETRGILFGNDNCGRGRIGEGRDHYGDYFRTMRWFSAPGCDDPKLQGPRAFKGLKVNSSIAQLYGRRRVWIEAFHSSGWGTTPAEVISAINEDFAYGATLVNLHGLYYSTFGGWWEWAPPDFHFRQPYWEHSHTLNRYLTRISWLLSQGTHRCDVVVVYPIAALDARAAVRVHGGVLVHAGNESIDLNDARADSEESAFSIGKHLFDASCDFDFIDFESVDRATCDNGILCVSGGAYRVLILPAMAAVHYSTLIRAFEFVRSGGVVIAYGCLPVASDRAGRNDPVLDQLVEDIFGPPGDGEVQMKAHGGHGRAFYFARGHSKVLAAINASIVRDVTAAAPLHVVHRHLHEREIFYLFNPAEHAVTTAVSFRDEGQAVCWNPWTGASSMIDRGQPLAFAAREAKVIVLEKSSRAGRATRSIQAAVGDVQRLDGLWSFQSTPTLDNRFGDFSLPATEDYVTPEARRFLCTEANVNSTDWVEPAFDDAAWPESTFSFGPRLAFIGPLPPGSALPADVDPDAWQPYNFSTRWGIERDPFLTDWLSGPHGLKGKVPDEFLDFHCDTPGAVWYLRTTILANTAGEWPFQMGGRCAYGAWINGNPVLIQESGMQPGFHAPWNIPHYDCAVRSTRVCLLAGSNSMIVRLVQPAGQRTRAFFRFTSEIPLQEIWLRGFHCEHLPRPSMPAPTERKEVRFRFLSPPGLRALSFVARGPARLWVDGNAVTLDPVAPPKDGIYAYRAKVAAATAGRVALAVDAAVDSRLGDALPEPVKFDCGPGLIELGDWCEHGLAAFSGLGKYSRTVHLSHQQACGSVVLDLGALSATAMVEVNGLPAATLITPPWRCEISPFTRVGNNEITVTVANTLANHYSVGNPSPYAFSHQTPSGLFGPVSLQFA